jgi:RHS repeat-associated protein
LTTAGTAYDQAGNLMAVGGSGLTASYDAENRQVSAGNGAQTSYGYDGNGRRVSKLSAGVTTVYVYDALDQLAAEYSTAAASAPCRTCYLSWDHLGSTRMVTDQNGTVVARHDYLPFGQEIIAGYGGRPSLWGGLDTVNQKFTGKERDTESGLGYFGARYYGSSMGRFMSPDHPLIDQHPENPQSWNLYAYARNNPLINIDPTGLGCITDLGQGSDANHESVEFNNSISSDDCGNQNGTWGPVTSVQITPGLTVIRMEVSTSKQPPTLEEMFISRVSCLAHKLMRTELGLVRASHTPQQIGFPAKL